MPKRIQLSRKKGWRKPEGAVVVARPSLWGNPFVIGKYSEELGREMTRQDTVDQYAAWLEKHCTSEDFTNLRGKDLCCWCPLDKPCHADVLLRLANQ